MAELSRAARALKGLKFLAAAPDPIPVVRPRPPEPAAITMTELMALVAGRQRRETEGGYLGDRDPLIVWLEVGPDEFMAEAMALKDMALAYGIYAGWRQLATTPTEGE